ncbi:dual oxidase maturation factor 1-like [Ischnura elegans]|uniref:dual oxidase maturation factor 1-like n=1 Tax=Ischnura elegans TaxID=197161 RepID=UPI001ED87A43|nr:dual oxidase maturation factor 1-like [Ischnura elegans]
MASKRVEEDTVPSGSLFSYGRAEGFPSQYPENRTPVTVDVVEVGIIFSFACLSVCFAAILLPRYDRLPRIMLVCRAVIGMVVASILLTSNYGQNWEVGVIKATVPYKAGVPDEIKADIGVHIGLRSVNITLKSEGKDKGTGLKNEEINYNERFSWTWDQGRIGFGPFAGRFQQEFRAAQRRGLPLPILWLAEYFTIDGEGFRIGRFYRTAGWYAHVALWAAVPAWIMSNLLFLTVVRYGALWAVITGLLQLMACLIWCVVKNPIPLEVPYNTGHLITGYGIDFWKTVFSGCLCIVFGVIVLLCDLRFPDETSVFFSHDPLSEYEECHLDPEEVDLMRTRAAKQWEEVVRQRKREELMKMQPSEGTDGDGNYYSLEEMGSTSLTPRYSVSQSLPLQPTQLLLKRGTTVRRVQRGLIRTPAPVDPTDFPIYLGVQKEL